MKVAVIFPGWGTPKKLYQKLNLEVEYKILVNDFNLKNLRNKIDSYKPDKMVFIGWSLGAMRALQYLECFPVDKLILLSPTLYFLDNQLEIIVKRMKRNIETKKLETLIQFSNLNFHNLDKCQGYLQDYKDELHSLDKEYLKQGLDFLLEKDLRDLEFKQNIEPIIIVGEEDEVIANCSSEEVLDKFSSAHYFSLSNVGHNLIYEAKERVNNIITDYI